MRCKEDKGARKAKRGAPPNFMSGCVLVSTTTAVRPDWQSFLQASARVSLCKQDVVSRSSTTSETR